MCAAMPSCVCRRLICADVSYLLAAHAAGKPGIPEGVVGLDGAIEALDLADMLVPAIKQCWNAGEPWTWTPPKT